jgi:hypothetical protein
MPLVLRVLLVASLWLAVGPGIAAAAEPGVHGPHGRPETTSEDELRETLRRLHRRRIALTVHQVLATTAFVSILTSSTFSVINVTLLARGVTGPSLLPTTVAERVAGVVALGSYSPAGIIAWASPSPTGYIQGKGLSKFNTTRDRHQLLSILHGILYVAYWTSGLVAATAAPPEALLPLGIVHTAFGFGAAITIGAAGILVARF